MAVSSERGRAVPAADPRVEVPAMATLVVLVVLVVVVGLETAGEEGIFVGPARSGVVLSSNRFQASSRFTDEV